MSMAAFDLESYLAGGVENVVKGILKTSAFCPEELAFMTRYAAAARRATHLRGEAAERGEHIPPFLIASITSVCNLHCAGCYARSLDSCSDGVPVEQLTAGEWGKLFRQARDLGISFILLAGGEPLVRSDVMREAAALPEILFPVFTNGTLLTGELLDLMDKRRNLVPVLSIEGGAEKTDARRGAGIYKRLTAAMSEMKRRKMAFGASVTVTRENLEEVSSPEYVESLRAQGCRGIIYVEYVPTDEATAAMAPDDEARERFAARLRVLREDFAELLFISFPGDEKSSGGCLAAGRGFFHINSHGGAEPCPFSPYSDVNVRDMGLRTALASPLFTALRSGELLIEDHAGGCVLYERRDRVEALLAAEG